MEQLVQAFLETFRGLGAHGKPQPHEHTTLAGIVVKFDDTYVLDETRLGGSYVFVAMATGTRCIPAASRCPKGSTVHDGHAEVLARRVFNRWLLEEIENCRNGERSLIFLKDGDKPLCLRDGVSFELLISALPCGDASIVEQEGRKRDRTGAKIVPQDGSARLPEAGDVESHDCSQTRGVVRRKPGKGSPTSSVSCSDKILKWNMLGFQGCFMLPFIQEPLYFSQIIALTSDEGGAVGNVDTAASTSMQRALWERACNLKEYLEGSLFVRQTSPRFAAIPVNVAVLEEHGLIASSTRKVSPGISAMWWAKASKDWKPKRLDYISYIPKGDKNYCEVIIGKTGVKMGFQKPTTDPFVCRKACSRISRASMRDLVQRLCASRDKALDSGIIPHQDLKLSVCPEYVQVWNKLRQPGSTLSNWIRKS